MRGKFASAGAALAGAVVATAAVAQPAVRSDSGLPAMRAPLWRGIERIVIDFSFRGGDAAFADRLRGGALAAARSRTAWPVSTDPTDAICSAAILSIRYDGTALSADVRRAVSIDDAEGARVVQPIALSAAADPAAIDAAIAYLIARALPRATPEARNTIRIHREN